MTGATAFTFYAFRTGERPQQDAIIFRYHAPTGADPYAQQHVENTDNWLPDQERCASTAAQQVACSISVPSANTMNGGSQIDPEKVTIYSAPSPMGGNNRIVESNPNEEYTDEVNKPLP